MLSTEKFFSAFDKAGMLKEASWTPSVGLPGAGVEQKVKGRYRAPSREVLAGEVFSTDYSFQYPAALFPGIVRGQVISIAGHGNFKLREDPQAELDGTRLVIVLEKV